jgi:hypothetical protein
MSREPSCTISFSIGRGVICLIEGQVFSVPSNWVEEIHYKN